MSNYLVSDTDLTSVANAIRTKGGTSAQLEFPTDFVSAIGDIPSESDDFIETMQETLTSDESFSLTSTIFNASNVNALVLLNATGSSGQYNAQRFIYGASKLEYIVLPKVTRVCADFITSCSSIKAMDFTNVTRFDSGSIKGNSAMNILVIRASNVPTLASVDALQNTPFASGKAGGTLFVPNSLISSFQSASNWSTILGYTTNSIQKIEGSIYDGYYVNGMAIPT